MYTPTYMAQHLHISITWQSFADTSNEYTHGYEYAHILEFNFIHILGRGYSAQATLHFRKPAYDGNIAIVAYKFESSIDAGATWVDHGEQSIFYIYRLVIHSATCVICTSCIYMYTSRYLIDL